VHLLAAPTGTGKTLATARAVATMGRTCWLADRHEAVDEAVQLIEGAGRAVGRVVPLHGETAGVPNCLHADTIEVWQAKGYNYRVGYCPGCERHADPNQCPFLGSLAGLAAADTIAATKALARRPGFFSKMGNSGRQTVVLDEDPIGLLRPPVEIRRGELLQFLEALGLIDQEFEGRAAGRGSDPAALPGRALSGVVRRIAIWCWERIAEQPPGGQPAAVDVPRELRPPRAVLRRTRAAQRLGRKELQAAFHRMMRADPARTVRNVLRDLLELVRRAAGATAFAAPEALTFHLEIKIPRRLRVIVLDATANPELLRPLFAPRPVRVHLAERVQPAGRVIQFVDFNGPRSTLNEIPGKAVRIIDALGDLHPVGEMVLISHQSCVQALAKASRHSARIRTAHFGALRGRNDLESGPGRRVACHVVIGSPKTSEGDRRQLALAVYGRSVLPFADLETVRRVVRAPVPTELEEGVDRFWEIMVKGYPDPRMQSVYAQTVTAELVHAADRARVLVHPGARVYLVTNEPCPALWFAEVCLAGELLDLTPGPRADFARACAAFAAKAAELLNEGKSIGNADVCQALGRKPGWGLRYWRVFVDGHRDALEGGRKVRWKRE
jgi:hypothetical protein